MNENKLVVDGGVENLSGLVVVVVGECFVTISFFDGEPYDKRESVRLRYYSAGVFHSTTEKTKRVGCFYRFICTAVDELTWKTRIRNRISNPTKLHTKRGRVGGR